MKKYTGAFNVLMIGFEQKAYFQKNPKEIYTPFLDQFGYLFVSSYATYVMSSPSYRKPVCAEKTRAFILNTKFFFI